MTKRSIYIFHSFILILLVSIILTSCSEEEDQGTISNTKTTSETDLSISDSNLIFSDITASDINVAWTSASYTGDTDGNIDYMLVYSINNNISTVDDALSNGTVAMDWTPSVSTASITGLSEGSLYYMNLLARSPDGDTVTYNSDGTYTRIDTGQIFHLDAINQTPIADGATVTNVEDFSGNNNNLTIMSTSWPTYTESGLNGNPVLNFPPSGGIYTNSATGIDGIVTLTIVSVHAIPDLGQNSTIVQTGGVNGLAWWFSGGDYFYGEQNNSFNLIGTQTTSSGITFDTSYHVVSVQHGASDSPTTISLDGLAYNTDNWNLPHSNLQHLSTITLTGNTGGVYMGELVIYDFILTSSQLAAVNCYLGHKWGLTMKGCP